VTCPLCKGLGEPLFIGFECLTPNCTNFKAPKPGTPPTTLRTGNTEWAEFMLRGRHCMQVCSNYHAGTWTYSAAAELFVNVGLGESRTNLPHAGIAYEWYSI
jgi:hypothetical protein